MNLPPKTLQVQVRRLGRESNGSIEKETHTGGSLVSAEEKAGPLPVLEAFHEFLNLERERMRKRMLLLSVFLLIMFLCVVGGGLFVGMTFSKRVDRDFAAFKAESLDVRNDTQLSLLRFAEETGRMHDDLTKEITRDRDALEAARSEIKGYVSSYDGDLQEIRDVVETLELENDSLKKDLSVMKNGWPALSSAVETVLKEIERLYSSNPVSSADTIVIPIVPRGRTRPIAWRLPIPE